MRQYTHGLRLHAKFHLNVFIVSASGGQKPQFWANLTFGKLPLYRTPFTDEGQIQYVRVDPRSTLSRRSHAKFSLDRSTLSPSGGEKKQILPFY